MAELTVTKVFDPDLKFIGVQIKCDDEYIHVSKKFQEGLRVGAFVPGLKEDFKREKLQFDTVLEITI